MMMDIGEPRQQLIQSLKIYSQPQRLWMVTNIDSLKLQLWLLFKQPQWLSLLLTHITLLIMEDGRLELNKVLKPIQMDHKYHNCLLLIMQILKGKIVIRDGHQLDLLLLIMILIKKMTTKRTLYGLHRSLIQQHLQLGLNLHIKILKWHRGARKIPYGLLQSLTQLGI
jgi:hypothetical protein